MMFPPGGPKKQPNRKEIVCRSKCTHMLVHMHPNHMHVLAIFSHLGVILGHLGATLGDLPPSWSDLRPSWNDLGPSWGDQTTLRRPDRTDPKGKSSGSPKGKTAWNPLYLNLRHPTDQDEHQEKHPRRKPKRKMQNNNFDPRRTESLSIKKPDLC